MLILCDAPLVSLAVTPNLDATSNWWGDPSGPSDDGSGMTGATGTGDSVSVGVDFSNFLPGFPLEGCGLPNTCPPPSITASQLTFVEPAAADCGPPIPCPEIEDIYTDPGVGFDPRVGALSGFSQFLTDANPNAGHREACLRLYEDVIFWTLYHELSEDTYFSMSELDFLDGTTYSSVNSGFMRNIAADGSETSPFLNNDIFNVGGDLRYLFARTAVNGIIGVARQNSDPMRYFVKNFSTAFSDDLDDPNVIGDRVKPNSLLAFGSPNFCGSHESFHIRDVGEPSNVSCVYRDWYRSEAIPTLRNLEPFREVDYQRVIRAVRQAIRDEVMGIADPTGFATIAGNVWQVPGAIESKPANRIWFGREQLWKFDSRLGPVRGHHEAFVFETSVGQLTELTWRRNCSPVPCNQCSTTSCTADFWYPDMNADETLIDSIIRNVTAPTPAPRTPNQYPKPHSCVVSGEAIPEAYMRHLRELFWPSSWNMLLNGDSVEKFNLDNGVRAGLNRPAVHIHALRVEPVDETANGFVASSLRWFSFMFQRPRQGDEPFETKPITGNEFVVMSNSQVLPPLPQPTTSNCIQ